MTREFFQAVQEKLPRTSIGELRTPNGNSTKQQKDIEEACISFYKELYTSPARDNLTSQSEQEILDAISYRIPPLTASGPQPSPSRLRNQNYTKPLAHWPKRRPRALMASQ